MGYLFLVVALTLNAAATILLKIGAMRLGGLEEPASSRDSSRTTIFSLDCCCSR